MKEPPVHLTRHTQGREDYDNPSRYHPEFVISLAANNLSLLAKSETLGKQPCGHRITFYQECAVTGAVEGIVLENTTTLNLKPDEGLLGPPP